MELDVERAAARANITTFSDALWWAMSTVSTVGYGDHYPVTAAGRAIGVMLMIAGVGIFGVTPAAAAAWFVSADRAEERQQEAGTLTGLTAEITVLCQAVSELSARLAPPAERPARERPVHRHTRPGKPSPRLRPNQGGCRVFVQGH